MFKYIKNRRTHTEADLAPMGDLHVPWGDLHAPWGDLHVPWENRVRPRSSPEGEYRGIWDGKTWQVSIWTYLRRFMTYRRGPKGGKGQSTQLEGERREIKQVAEKLVSLDRSISIRPDFVWCFRQAEQPNTSQIRPNRGLSVGTANSKAQRSSPPIAARRSTFNVGLRTETIQ